VIGWLARTLVLGALGLVACGEPASVPSELESPRLARRFLPRDSAWIPEDEVPREPQREPAMVIWELDAAPQRPPTSAERAAADELVARSQDAAERHGWFDFQRGRADGYRLLHGDKRHYYNEAHLFDDAILDPDRPEFLMYYGTPRGQKLAGLMFYSRRPDERGLQVGGPLTRWHYHVWAEPNCLVRGLLSVASARGDDGCVRGRPSHRSPEMLHVWLLDHPDGPFATSMWLRPEQLQALIERDDQR
jgi:hypothetical protein